MKGLEQTRKGGRGVRWETKRKGRVGMKEIMGKK